MTASSSTRRTPRSLAVVVRGVGLLGPGLPDWPRGSAFLHNAEMWVQAVTAVPAPARLPATERRRAGTVVKASIAVADEAITAAGADAATLATVFTSSTGDPVNCHLLCEALAAPERLMSPTRFTNSVHNAAAGYWHIAAGSRAPSTSFAAFDASFAAGLLEAAVQVRSSVAPVLLVACDVPYPEPLHALRPLPDSFAVALLLAPGGEGPRLLLRYGAADAAGATSAATPCADNRLEALRTGIPAARALPLLEALSHATRPGAGAACVVLEALPGNTLSIDIHPATTA